MTTMDKEKMHNSNSTSPANKNSIRKPVYLDYAATTPVDPRVAEKMIEFLTLESGGFGNPASRSHRYGWHAEEAVDIARNQVADLIQADPREIVWTSGATESDNLAIKGVAEAYKHKGNHIITSAIEHKAVIDTCLYLEEQGFRITFLEPNSQGEISLEQVKGAIDEDTILVSLMMVNNEIGTITDVGAIGAFCRDKKIIFHVDAAQAAGKIAIDVRALNIDLMSLSGHKVYGPKGVGALYVRRSPDIAIKAIIHGGGHEKGMRSGTLATHQIAGMGEAFAIAAVELENESTKLQALKVKLWEGLKDLGGMGINGLLNGVPGIINISVEGVEGETLLMSVFNLAVSSGSACNSASVEPSFVLKAMGVDPQLAESSIRLSMGRFTTAEEVDYAIHELREVITRLREFGDS